MLLTKDALVSLLEKNREKAQKDLLCPKDSLQHTGFITITRGAILTSDNPMSAGCREKQELRKKRDDERERVSAQRSIDLEKDERRRVYECKLNEFVFRCRARIACILLETFSPNSAS